MYKDIVLSDGIDAGYLQSIRNFKAEWESLSARHSQAGYSPVLQLATSGSTGTPKTIEFTKQQAEASAKYTGRFFHFKTGDAVLLNLSPNFVAGKLMIVRALVHELTLVIAPLQENPLKGLKNFPEKIKLAAFVPHQVEAILNDEDSRRLFNEIEHVIVGGASVPDVLEQKIAQQKPRCYATFGMTETLTHFALRPLDGKTRHYTCLPGITIDLDERGCLVVHPNDILEKELVTNDLIEKISATEFIWQGRFDNLINSGGVKIFPESDEKLLEHLFNHTRFYLSSKKHATFGEEVALVLEGQQQLQQEQQEILEKIETVLPKYHAPKSIIYLPKFEETANGKVKRRKF